jgi:hypothetical protein
VDIRVEAFGSAASTNHILLKGQRGSSATAARLLRLDVEQSCFVSGLARAPSCRAAFGIQRFIGKGLKIVTRHRNWSLKLIATLRNDCHTLSD